MMLQPEAVLPMVMDQEDESDEDEFKEDEEDAPSEDEGLASDDREDTGAANVEDM